MSEQRSEDLASETPTTSVAGVPDTEQDLHGPPHDHPHLPSLAPEDNPIVMLHRAAGIEDQDERALALTENMVLIQQWVEWGSRQRDRAILQMRDSKRSYDDVARTLGITKSRAAQICRRLQRKYPDGVAGWRLSWHHPNV